MTDIQIVELDPKAQKRAKAAERMRQWRADNPERWREIDRASRERRREKLRIDNQEYCKRYRLRHPDEYRERRRLRTQSRIESGVCKNHQDRMVYRRTRMCRECCFREAAQKAAARENPTFIVKEIFRISKLPAGFNPYRAVEDAAPEHRSISVQRRGLGQVFGMRVSDRLIQAARMLIKGGLNKPIARKVGMEPETVAKLRRRMSEHLGRKIEPKRANPRMCKVQGCERMAVDKYGKSLNGMCPAHYHRQYRAKRRAKKIRVCRQTQQMEAIAA